MFQLCNVNMNYKDIFMADSSNKKKIAYLNSTITAPWSKSLWIGLIKACKENNVNLISYIGGELDSPVGTISQKNMVYDLIDNDYHDGAIIWSGCMNWYITKEKNDAFVKQFLPLPIVTLEVPTDGVPCINHSSKKNMRDLFAHLIEVHGKKRIAYIKGLKNHLIAIDRYNAYLSALKEFGIPFDKNNVSKHLDTTVNMDDDINELIDRTEGNIDAILCHNDLIAIPTISLLQKRGIRVPEDIFVTGYDGISISRINNPPITSVKYPHEKMGKVSMETILKIIDGQSISFNINLEGTFVIRDSCGCESKSIKKLTLNKNTKINKIEKIVNEAGTLYNLLDKDWADNLRKSFFNYFKNKEKNSYFHDLKKYITQTESDVKNIPLWQNIITEFWHQAKTDSMVQETHLRDLDFIIQKSRLLVSEISARVQAHSEYDANELKSKVNDIGQKFSTTLDLPLLLDAIAEDLPKIGIPCCYISLFTDANNLDEACLIMAYDSNGIKQIDPDSMTFKSKMLIPSKIQFEDNHSLLVLPLYFNEEKIGFIIFGVGPHDPDIYEILSNRISSSINRASLVNKINTNSKMLKESLNKINKELETAKNVQMAILPKNLNEVYCEKIVTYFKTSGFIGGDIYDVKRIGLNKYAFLVADVSGHGIPAALYSFLTKNSFSRNSNPKSTPEKILFNMNNDIEKDITGGNFVTAFIGILDSEKMEFEYSSAGHPATLLLRKNKSSVNRLYCENAFLGLIENFEYTGDKVKVDSGDRIIIYSDGLIEAVDKNRKMFDIKNVEQQLFSNRSKSLKESADDLINSFNVFTDYQELQDDVTFILFEVK